MNLKFILTISITFFSYFTSAQINENGFNNSNNIKYSSNDYHLEKKYGKLLIPNKNSKYNEGVDGLKKYFAENAITSSEFKDLHFMVKIVFIVNSDGNANHFEIISSTRKEAVKLRAEKVLQIVKKMPQKWEAAEDNGKKVDSYQILSFTIIDGDLTKVNYR